MAQLLNSLRITFEGARIEKSGGRLPWQRKVQDQDVWLDWRAETRRREGAEWVEETVATGHITGAEVLFWADWFANAAHVQDFPTQLGPTPTIPVARLWTPLSGAAAEFFLWPEPTGGLALMALFTPDEARPDLRRVVETSVTADVLATFGEDIASEYDALRTAASQAP